MHRRFWGLLVASVDDGHGAGRSRRCHRTEHDGRDQETPESPVHSGNPRISSVPDAMTPSTGWGVLHLFGLVDAESDREAIISAVKNAQSDGHQVVSFAVLG